MTLTFLFNFIEFFEKIVRVKHATMAMILHFIALQTIPSFFETFVISSWLATCLLIKEFAQHNEWEAFQILNINHKKIFNLFFMAGAILAACSFIGREKIALDLLNKSEKFKLEKLKQTSQQKIATKWLQLSEFNSENPTSKTSEIICYFDFLDLEINQGSNLLLLYMSSDFEIEKTLICPTFQIQPKTNSIFISNSTIITTNNNKQIDVKNNLLDLPSFFSQLQLNIQIPSIYQIVLTLISGKKTLPKEIWNDLLAKLLSRIFIHFQLIIYPLLTLCLFLLFPYHPKYKWFLIFVPYPLIITLTTLVNSLVQKGFSPWTTIIPYLFLFTTILLCKKRLEKTF